MSFPLKPEKKTQSISKKKDVHIHFLEPNVLADTQDSEEPSCKTENMQTHNVDQQE
jgi:hypothetical protein